MEKSENSFKLLLEILAGVTLLLAPIIWVYLQIKRGHENKYAIVKTIALIQALDTACKAYRINFGVYPPNDMCDSRCLHYYLGRPRIMLPAQRDDAGPFGTTVKYPPLIDFPAEWLQLQKGQIPDPNQPVPIVDAWGNPIKYVNPGRFNPLGVDIWSPGQNGKDEPVPKGSDSDDIANWQREY
jgi:hypothetical protein